MINAAGEWVPTRPHHLAQHEAQAHQARHLRLQPNHQVCHEETVGDLVLQHTYRMSFYFWPISLIFVNYFNLSKFKSNRFGAEPKRFS